MMNTQTLETLTRYFPKDIKENFHELDFIYSKTNMILYIFEH